MTDTNRYTKVMERAAELADLESAASLVSWDQEAKMPKKGIAGRSHVTAALAGLYHEKFTDPGLGEDLERLTASGGLDEVEARQIAELKRLRDRAAKLPRKLVQTMAELHSRATAAWAEARAAKDFPSFAPLLEETFRLKREMADAIGHDGEPYDALLNEFEPGARTEDVVRILEAVRDFLIPVVRDIGESPVRPDPGITAGPFDETAQDTFGREVVAAMGFDLEAGRLDTSAHPFTSGIHEGDTRLTTRYKPDLSVGLFGTIHEAGHGLYEQNLPREFRRTPVGVATSLGIHESQSRLWENMVGRNRNFWVHFFPRLQKAYPGRLGSVSLDDFHLAVNHVRPSLIRIEADEVTYNLHIVLRVELERDLIGGRLAVNDLPEAWDGKIRKYLGITPPSVDVGVLQDIHWASGLIGYFATYSLGNLYAAQFFAAAGRDIGDLEARIAKGELLPLRDWLVERVHRVGRRYDAEEIVQRATGKAPSTEDFEAYIRSKFGALYNLSTAAGR